MPSLPTPPEVRDVPTDDALPPDRTDRRSPLRDLERAPQFRGAPRWAGAARVAVLALSDAAALSVAGMLAYLAWALPVHGQDLALYLAVAPAILLMLLGYAQVGLYPGFGLGPVEVLRRYWLVTTLAFLVLASLVFGLKVQDQYSRVTLALAFLLSLALLGMFRWGTTRVGRRWSWWPEPVLVVGEPRGTRLTEELFRGRMGQEFRPVGILRPEAVMGTADGRAVSPADFAREGVQVVFTDAGGPGSDALLEHLRTAFPRVVTIRAIEELPVEGVQIRNLGGTLGLEYGNNLLRRQSRWVKRTLDLVLGTIALVLTLPLALGAVLAVKLLSPGPALFWQPREGSGGRTIQVPKIRTMVVDAERKMEELFVQDPRLKDEWENGFKLKEDPRIIPVVGRILRRYSIDELPQLWSVIRGDMSLVGPRPFPAYHLEALSSEARHLRSQVRPGISGLWQVSARGLADVATQQSYDVYYIRNWSVWLDLHVLFRTISAVITGRGAY
jgi:Undecaprenyl-phosphate galactose phosphotransferase WbaP